MGVAARLVSLAVCLGMLVGCGDGDDDAGSADDGSLFDQETTELGEAGEGTLSADPEAIRPFSNPATQISSDADLVAYLLPGLTGSGVDCLETGLDAERLLDSEVDAGAELVATGILACVAPDEIGKIIGMYAVGFEDDGASRYADLAVCVAEGFAALDRPTVERVLIAVYTERLALYGPPDSRVVAASAIERLTDC